jgi:hypothetical protein
LAVEVSENHVQARTLDVVSAIDLNHTIPLWHELLYGGSLPCEFPTGVSQPISNAVVAAFHPTPDIADQPMQTPQIKHPLALVLCLHISVATLL